MIIPTLPTTVLPIQPPAPTATLIGLPPTTPSLMSTHQPVPSISYSTVVLYIRDHGDLGFPSHNIHPTTSFTTLSWHLGSIG